MVAWLLRLDGEEETCTDSGYVHYLDCGDGFIGVCKSKHIVLSILNTCNLFYVNYSPVKLQNAKRVHFSAPFKNYRLSAHKAVDLVILILMFLFPGSSASQQNESHRRSMNWYQEVHLCLSRYLRFLFQKQRYHSYDP